MDEKRKKIGRRIKELRLEKGISQQELAAIIGVTSKTVYRWEIVDKPNEVNSIPRKYACEKLAEIFRVDISEFMISEIEEETEKPVPISDSILVLFKKRMEEVEFKNGIYAGLLALLFMFISFLADKTGDSNVGWGFILLMLWSCDYFLHHIPNIHGLKFDGETIEVKVFRVINVCVSAVTILYVIGTQCMMLWATT